MAIWTIGLPRGCGAIAGVQSWRDDVPVNDWDFGESQRVGSDPDVPKGWLFPGWDARALVVLSLFLPAVSILVLSATTERTENKPYAIPAFILFAAVSTATAVVGGRARQRRGGSSWHGTSRGDLQTLKAAIRQSGWPPRLLWLSVWILNLAAVVTFFLVAAQSLRAN